MYLAGRPCAGQCLDVRKLGLCLLVLCLSLLQRLLHRVWGCPLCWLLSLQKTKVLAHSFQWLVLVPVACLCCTCAPVL